MSSRCLQDMTSRRLQGMSSRRLEDVLKTYWRYVLKMSWRRLQNQQMFAGLFVLNAHAAVFHSSVYSTLNYIHSNYWIVKRRQTIKQLLKRCFICEYVQGKCSLGPEVPLLPEFRVKCNCSFEFAGVDFAAPIYYKSRYKVCKACILWFTCGVIRAVNIELTKDLGNESLILTFPAGTATLW